MKFRKKPVVIEAMQFDGSWACAKSIIDWADSTKEFERTGWRSKEIGGELYIKTLEGVMTADAGDWIIRGIKGEIYPCKPDIFAATYEAAE
ncbi:hypothetical protein BK660_21860 [Pseudomonas brassicacearum]|uniref:Phage protein n=1 Tax=Pseudomonas brassicacearum TaxID=930166 RepID=A0A423HY10_9PSED|nr:hypothetical protein [Pseudomonas brassicacearum]RON17938.1 hypothetical protein BK660_21860 [Pseudomonas brassicacearum]